MKKIVPLTPRTKDAEWNLLNTTLSVVHCMFLSLNAQMTYEKLL